MGAEKKSRRKLGGAVALAALTALLLGGCAAPAGAPAAPVTSSPAEAPSRPTPESPTPPEPVRSADEAALDSVAGFVIRPALLELRDADGAVVLTLDYTSSAAEAIDTLNTVFGVPPSEEPYSGNLHNPPGIYHSWDGLVLDERLYTDEQRASHAGYYFSEIRFAIYLESPAAYGLPMSSAGGAQAGDSWDFALGTADVPSELWTCIGTPVEIGEVTPGGGTPTQLSVVIRETDDGGTVRSVAAPEPIADGCV